MQLMNFGKFKMIWPGPNPTSHMHAQPLFGSKLLYKRCTALITTNVIIVKLSSPYSSSDISYLSCNQIKMKTK